MKELKKIANVYIMKNRENVKQDILREKSIIEKNCLVHKKIRKYYDFLKILLHLALQELKIQRDNIMVILPGNEKENDRKT